MQNIYDIRLNENLLFVLPQPEQNSEACFVAQKNVAIAVNLYYEDLVAQNMDYLNCVPEAIDVYVISSRQDVLEKVEKLKKRPLYFIEKNNRGRDVSALLVAFREIALQYEYICFVHDKKPKFGYIKEDVDIWIRNLWENTIGSVDYIYGVLACFKKCPDIGLMVPPEPFGEYYTTWYSSGWGNNFENAKALAEELKLNCNLDEDKSPLAFGTVFWARTVALNKLLMKEWKYEDFPEEPMPIDDTISHAIERILGFVAQDSGYKTATIMSDSYAAWNLLFAQDSMKKMRKLMAEQVKVHNIHQIEKLSEQEECLRNFCQNNKQVYLYGAGMFGKELLWHMKNWGLQPTGFVVSNGKRNQDIIEGYPVFELRELKRNDGIVIATHYKNQEEMEEILKQEGFVNYIMGYI